MWPTYGILTTGGVVLQGDATYNLSCKIILPARSTEMDAHEFKKSIMLQSVVAYRLVKGMRLFNFTKNIST